MTTKLLTKKVIHSLMFFAVISSIIGIHIVVSTVELIGLVTLFNRAIIVNFIFLNLNLKGPRIRDLQFILLFFHFLPNSIFLIGIIISNKKNLSH